MKVLLTNDDGPPGEASPYVVPLVKEMHAATNWDVTVVLPDSQKSWISKAIFISEKVVESYYNPSTGIVSEERVTQEDWFLLSGTPATCSAIGIHHLCKDKPDLLISGPNLGRNTSSVSALASGTIGAALEAATAGVKAIAVSYAFWNKESKAEWVEAAGKLTVKLAQHLYDNWDEGVDLYTINVPLCSELVEGKSQIWKTHIHSAQHSCLFQPTSAVPLAEVEFRAAQSAGMNTTAPASEDKGRRTYEFRPTFEDFSQRLDTEEGRQSDNWAIAQKNVSVTPLKANFQHVPYNAKDRVIKL